MKNKYISKRYWNDITTPMSESENLSRDYDDLIDLSIGDPDLHTDERVINSAFTDAKDGHTHYTEPAGYLDLRIAICEHYKVNYNYNVSVEECMVTTSGCHGMWLVLETILDDGDEVIIPEPYFTPYPQQVVLTRGKPVFFPTLEEEGFQINTEALQRYITNRSKAIIINTPNNPTGVCYTKETLKDIAQLAIEHDLIVIADDIYTAFSYDEPFIPITTLEGMRERTISVRSFSKDYCMTGWRVGCVVAPKDIIKEMLDINENNVFTAPSISQRAALHALTMKDEVQIPIINEFKTRLKYAYKRVENNSYLSAVKANGGLYVYINIKKTGLTSKEFCSKLLKEKHILVLPGYAFGESGEGYIRIALTVEINKLKEAFDRMESWIK